MHIYVSNLTIIGSDNGLSPGRRQAIIWTNAGILLIEPIGINLSEILSKIQTFSFKKKHFKMLSGKWCPFCLGLNVLIPSQFYLWQAIQSSFPTHYLPSCSPKGIWLDCMIPSSNGIGTDASLQWECILIGQILWSSNLFGKSYLSSYVWYHLQMCHFVQYRYGMEKQTDTIRSLFVIVICLINTKKSIKDRVGLWHNFWEIVWSMSYPECSQCMQYHAYLTVPCINLSPSGQNGHHFTDNIFKCISLDENAWIVIKLSVIV